MNPEILALLQQLHEENLAILTTTFTSARSQLAAQRFEESWKLKMARAIKPGLAQPEITDRSDLSDR